MLRLIDRVPEGQAGGAPARILSRQPPAEETMQVVALLEKEIGCEEI